MRMRMGRRGGVRLVDLYTPRGMLSLGGKLFFITNSFMFIKNISVHPNNLWP